LAFIEYNKGRQDDTRKGLSAILFYFCNYWQTRKSGH